MTSSTAPPGFNAAEIHDALKSLVAILEDADPTKRAYAYTEDTTFVMPGAPVIHGRNEMLSRLKTGTLLSSVRIVPHSIEGEGGLAYAYGNLSCLAGRTTTELGRPVSLHFLMVWRKELDGV